MSNGFLTLIIEPKIAGDDIKFDKDNAIKCYLTHTKARMLANEIKTFLASGDKIKSAGVASGSCLITIDSGEAFGCGVCLVIRKVDDEGRVVSQYLYEFKTNYNYGIRNFEDDTKYFDKEYSPYDHIEIEQVIMLLEQFAEAMTYGNAFAVSGAIKVTNNMVNKKIDNIAEKLGVAYKSKTTSGSGNTFFNNNKSGNSGSAPKYENVSADSIISEFED